MINAEDLLIRLHGVNINKGWHDIRMYATGLLEKPGSTVVEG